MKKLIFVVLIMISTISILAQTLYTPNGGTYTGYDYGYSPYDSTDLASWVSNNIGAGNLYPNSYVVGEWEDGIWEYNCHQFAWNNWQGAERWSSENDIWKRGKPSPYNLMWKDYPDVYITDATQTNNNTTGINSYIVTTNQSEAAIITYGSYSGPVSHSARIVGDGTRFISKWGSRAIINHPPTEVPTGYGPLKQYFKINPAYRPIGDGDLVDRDWGTISDALVDIESGNLIRVLSGTQTISGNITIPSGVRLEITAGATLNFQSGSSLTVNGTLICRNNLTVASGAVLYIGSGATVNFASGTQLIVHGRIVANNATFEPISGSWNGILVDGSPASSFDDCSITGIGNSACGITFGDSYSGSHQVSDSYIEGGTAAIWIKNSSDPVISNSYLKGTGSNSVVLSSNNSNGKINDCKLYASNYQVIRGHYNMNTATPCYGDAWKYNIIDGTNFTTNGSSIYVSGGIPYFNYGYNSILPDSYLYQYSNYSGSTREARYNYWGGGAPVVQGYTVEDPNYLASQHANAGPNWTLSKSNAIDDLIFENTPLANAWNNYFDHNFTEAKEIAKEQFENNSKEEISTELLFLWMKSAMREGTLEKEESNLQSINKNTSINETSRYEAVRWLSKLAIREGDFETAESYIASVPSTSLMGREIIFDSADEIMENWGDLDKASALLEVVTTKYRDDETERQKEFVLNLYNSKKDSYKGSNKKETSKEETKVSSFALNPAYPNPFNPTTTISYQIPEQGFVTLKVYDMLGREVASLVNQKQTSGSYNYNFNASNLASGIYVYRITVQSFEGSKDYFTQSNKMILLK